MTCESSTKRTLLSSMPTASVPANVQIAHVQLRDLIVCPKERGVVWYIGDRCIIEHDLRSPAALPHRLAHLRFTPVTLAALSLSDDRVLLAAGGQQRELYLALYSYLTKRIGTSLLETDSKGDDLSGNVSEEIWHHFTPPSGSINNSVMLYLPPGRDVTSKLASNANSDWVTSAKLHVVHRPFPRLVVSNNDRTVKFFDINLTKGGFRKRFLDSRVWERKDQIMRYEEVGGITLPDAVNHTSISPDGSTLLSCGDSSKIYLHRISSSPDGVQLSFELIATYSLPAPKIHSLQSNSYLTLTFVDGDWPFSSMPASSCFSTAWNADGTKFAVASQEGIVLVWDVRSREPLPMAQWETVKSETEDTIESGHMRSFMRGSADETRSNNRSTSDTTHQSIPGHTYLSDHPQAWIDDSATAPAWGVRCVKFARNKSGREILVFTEHASLVHVINADTFDQHDIIRMPHVRAYPSRCVSNADIGYYVSPRPSDRSSTTSLRQTWSYPRVLHPSTFFSRSPEPLSPIASSGPSSSNDQIQEVFHEPSSRRRWLLRYMSRSREVAPSEFYPPDNGQTEENISRHIGDYSGVPSTDNSLSEERNVIIIPPLPDYESEHIRHVLARHGIDAVAGPSDVTRNPLLHYVNPTSSQTNQHYPSSSEDDIRRPRTVYARYVSQDDNVNQDYISDIDCALPSTSLERSDQMGSSNVNVEHSSHRISQPLPPCRDLIESTARLEIAGVAFDADGTYMYVATTDGITEWKVQGADTKWWCSGHWK